MCVIGIFPPIDSIDVDQSQPNYLFPPSCIASLVHFPEFRTYPQKCFKKLNFERKENFFKFKLFWFFHWSQVFVSLLSAAQVYN